MDQFSLIVDLYRRVPRQGPGSAETTLLALEPAGICSRGNRPGEVSGGGRPFCIADVGCGTGASTLVIAEALDAEVTAVDLSEEFLKVLDAQADKRRLKHRVETKVAAMDALPFGDEELDVIWSEGAIYIMGFKAGVVGWRRFLKPGGILGVSELTWIRPNPPDVIRSHWETEYPEVDTAAAKIAVLEEAGYSPLGYFALPASCWMDEFYKPLQAEFEPFLCRHGNSAEAEAIVEGTKTEIALYKRFGAAFSYGFYIARKL